MWTKKAQMWIVDFITALLVFMLIVIILTRFVFNEVPDNKFSELQSQVLLASDILMSEGFPSNWTNQTVIRAGFLTDNRLDTFKVGEFFSLDYEESKTYMATTFDYFIFFKNRTSVINISGCGNGHEDVVTNGCEISLDNVSYDDLLVVKRFVPMNGTIIEMVVYLWDD